MVVCIWKGWKKVDRKRSNESENVEEIEMVELGRRDGDSVENEDIVVNDNVENGEITVETHITVNSEIDVASCANNDLTQVKYPPPPQPSPPPPKPRRSKRKPKSKKK